MKKLFSLTLSLLMLIACSLGTVSAFAAEGEEPAARGPAGLHSDLAVRFYYLHRQGSAPLGEGAV